MFYSSVAVTNDFIDVHPVVVLATNVFLSLGLFFYEHSVVVLLVKLVFEWCCPHVPQVVALVLLIVSSSTPTRFLTGSLLCA